MTELELKIKEAQDAYYNNGTPIMSDGEFDILWDRLMKEQPDSELLKAVGSDHTVGFEKADHTMVMGSQNKANTAEEMDEWFSSIKGDIVGGYKMDGISIELTYIDGKYTKAITRGDGHTGDDVTANVAKMGGVIKELPDKSFSGPIRGEVLLSRTNKEVYFDEYANCRNAASGICKRLDGSGCEHLNVVVYDAQYLDKTKTFGTQYNLMKWLEGQGFEVAPWWLTNSKTGQYAKYKVDEVFAQFESLKYDIDGIVWKQNDIDLDDMYANIRPKTQIALKPARTYATTELIGIEWNNTNGTYTPVAILKPVNMLGAEISRANLSNVRKMMELGIEIGHTVTICRCGMIIPKVVKDETTGKFASGYEF